VKNDGLKLATYSGLILFFELALIRYTAGYVHLFSFYLNFVLIATFLGMGVGLMNGHRAPQLKWLAIPATLLVFGAVSWFSRALIQVPNDPDEFLWSIYIEPGRRRVSMLTMAATMFTVCSLLFVPLGALMGAEFRKLPPLRAYAWDIGGGLAGILLFGLLSAMRQEPLVWLVIGFGVWTLVSLPDRRFAAAIAVTGAAAILMAQRMDNNRPKSYWSPYYRINVRSINSAFQIDVNGSLHQIAMPFDQRALQFDYTALAYRGYQQPYRLLDKIDTALVVGAGSGNDLAMLLQRGAKYIDAVEIDPMIAEIGGDVHPMQPYSDPRVHLHVNDARAFLRTTQKKYDLIVFGTLDSQTLLSGMSSVRLDNYVYTVESFQAARAKLAPGGSLFVYHMSALDYISGKIYRMITQAFDDQPPGVFYGHMNLFNYVFVAGAAAPRVPPAPPERLTALRGAEADAHDDWPYLYLRGRTLPGHYIAALLAMLLVSAIFMGVGGRGALVRGFDGAMFFMGAGFLLVETKSVTEMSLLFGSTWTVNLLVFSSILVMVLIANMLVMRRPPARVTPLFFGLLASLAIAWSLPASRLLGLGVAGQWIVGGLMVALPIFFAAVIFSTLLSQREDGARALAYNLLGAIVGGALEYTSMIVGIKGLYVIAAVLYLCAMVLAWRRESRLLPARP
jgi:spermidine synthase